MVAPVIPYLTDSTAHLDGLLSAIAEAHGTTWQAIYASNKQVIGDDPDLIFPGQELSL